MLYDIEEQFQTLHLLHFLDDRKHVNPLVEWWLTFVRFS